MDGGRGADALTSGGGDETLIGGAGNDKFILKTSSGVGNDEFLGGAGVDKLILKSAGIFDLSHTDVIFDSIERILFETPNSGNAELILNAQEIDEADELQNAKIIGNDGGTVDLIKIVMGSLSSLNLNSWVFKQWNNLESELISIIGSGSVDTVVGTREDDKISGKAGDDKLKGSQGDDILFGGQGMDLLFGGSGLDRLKGGDDRDTLLGQSGNDTLEGGLGADLLTGGADSDVFKYNTVQDSLAAAGQIDKIKDFQQGLDLIDLSGIDAIAGGSDNAFNFIGLSGFSSTAGELRYSTTASATRIIGDIDGDSVADFQIKLLTSVNLLATDFVL